MASQEASPTSVAPLSDGVAEVYMASSTKAIAGQREIAAWIASTFLAVLGGLTLSTSFVRLRELDESWEFRTAFFSGIICLTGLFSIIWLALRVREWQRVIFADVAKGRNVSLSEIDLIEQCARRYYPENIATLKAFIADLNFWINTEQEQKKSLAANQMTSTSLEKAKERRKDFELLFKIMSADVQFVLVNSRFERLKKTTLFIGPLSIVSGITFIWVANPPRETPLLSKPSIEEAFKINPADKPMLNSMLIGDKCIVDEITLIIIRQEKDGTKEIVTAPKAGCSGVVRLKLAAGRLDSAP